MNHLFYILLFEYSKFLFSNNSANKLQNDLLMNNQCTKHAFNFIIFYYGKYIIYRIFVKKYKDNNENYFHTFKISNEKNNKITCFRDQ
jgi:hypothetical protein